MTDITIEKPRSAGSSTALSLQSRSLPDISPHKAARAQTDGTRIDHNNGRLRRHRLGKRRSTTIRAQQHDKDALGLGSTPAQHQRTVYVPAAAASAGSGVPRVSPVRHGHNHAAAGTQAQGSFHEAEQQQDPEPFASLGLDYSGLQASAERGGAKMQPSGLVNETMSSASNDPRKVTAATISLPKAEYTRSSDLVAAEQRYAQHRWHVATATRMVDVKTPHGYRQYRKRHATKDGSVAGLHSWLARPGQFNTLAPLSKMSLPPKRRSPTRRSGSPLSLDPAHELAMSDFYSQMASIERQMLEAPLCLAHKVMARLGEASNYGHEFEGPYARKAAIRIQRMQRGRAARKKLAQEKQARAVAVAEERKEAAELIQAQIRGRQARAETTILKAKEAAAEAAAIYAKEEEEARVAEALAAKEAEEARLAEAAFAKEEAEAVAAEEDAKREEMEAIEAESEAEREEAEAVQAKAVADKEAAEAEAAQAEAEREAAEARAAQAAREKEEKEAQLAVEIQLKEEEEARLAAELLAKEEEEARFAAVAVINLEEEVQQTRESALAQQSSVRDADAAIERLQADPSATDEALQEARSVLEREQIKYQDLQAVVARKEEELLEARVAAEREQAEAAEAKSIAEREQAEADEARQVAEQEATEAAAAAKRAEKEQAEADVAAALAAKEQEEADEAAAIAERERREADEARLIAQRERHEAEEAKRIAQRERAEAEEAKVVAQRERAEAEAAAEVARRERAEAEAARIEVERTAAAVAALEREAALQAERDSLNARVLSQAPVDPTPPEAYLPKKRSLWRRVLHSQVRGPPAAVQLRLVAVDRHQDLVSGADNQDQCACLLAIEIMRVINLGDILHLKPGQRAPACAVHCVILDSDQQLPTQGSVARTLANTHVLELSTISEISDVDGGGGFASVGGHGDHITISIEDKQHATFHGAVYIAPEHNDGQGGHQRKLGSFTLPSVHKLEIGAAVHEWTRLQPSAPTLHIKVSMMLVGTNYKLLVDVLEAYGDFNCGEIPDPYVKLGIEYHDHMSKATARGRRGSLAEFHKTKTLDNVFEPVWNESFVLNIDSAQMDPQSKTSPKLVLSLWDEDIGVDDLLGVFFFDGVADLARDSGQLTELWLESALVADTSRALGAIA